MEFQKYIHLERFGTDEVDGINIGKVHVFPKIDGTNASFWWGDGRLHCGSRNRELSLDDDNAGFMAWAVDQEAIVNLARNTPNAIFFGEWLVPHSLKTYRDEAWRKLYIFDVYDRATEGFVHYDAYVDMLSAAGVDFIPCIATGDNISFEKLCELRDKNTYLLQENQGAGEGIVVKQYGWQNRYGRTTWAKLITNHFRDKHVQEMGGAVINNKILEEEIADEYVTPHLVDKIVAKIRSEKGDDAGFGARDIPRLLGMAYHDLVTEELWEAVKKHKQPRIDFKTLNHCAIKRVKQLKPELFGAAA